MTIPSSLSLFNIISRLLILFLLLLSYSGPSQAAAISANSIDSISSESIIERVEPPFWWVGMRQTELQLLVYGQGIGKFKVKSPKQALALLGTTKTDNPNYLFINLAVAKDAQYGDYPIEFWNDGKKQTTHYYALKSRQKQSANRQGFSPKDVIYLITPDRFANGDLSNDRVEGYIEGVDRSNPNGRHGGDIQGIIQHLDYIEAMGFTQLWLNPVLENAHPKVTYHGYSTTDYYKVDPRFGSNQLYRQLSANAKARGIGLIKDVILNHIGTEHWWLKDLPSKDWINNPDTYIETTHRREALHDPHGTQEDIEAFASGWFVPTMADLNQRNPLVANYLIQNCIWWTEYANLSGLRVDTYSYSDKAFLSEFTKRLMSEYPDYNIVAEEWSVSPNIVAYWQRGNQTHDGYQSDLPSLMDFPLQDALVKGLTEKETWADGLRKLYELLAVDFVYPNSDNLVVFPDNHDMSRIYTQLNHDIELTKIAVALYATVRGIPQYFYGTEILMDNRDTGSHGVIRTDFPGGWAVDSRNAFSGRGLTDEQTNMQDFTKRLLNWRKDSKAIHMGKMTHYSPQHGIYVYFRHSQPHNDKVMIVINKDTQAKKLDTQRFKSMISAKERAHAVIDILNDESVDLTKLLELPAKSIRIFQF
jgi:neopullulanase